MYQTRSTSHLSLALPPSEPVDEQPTPAPTPKTSYGVHLLLLAGLGAGAVAGVFLGSGQHLGEKVLKAIATPIGFVWLLLFLVGYFSLLQRRTTTGLLVLLAWAILLPAPLEEPASSVKTPNPSKAPWYFLGLQEMLVYFDPWYAGVVLPSLVVFGLMAMPYLDFNKKGNGYYSIEERKFSYLTYQFGFFLLWITLIILGTFLRGPNWNFYGPFEYWTPYKVEVLNNVDLPQMFWVNLLDRPLPKAPAGASGLVQAGYVLLREAPGLLVMGAYLLLLPPLLAVTIFRGFFAKMGLVRYMIMANLMLLMLTLPIKMILRWTFNLKYIISMPEISLNF